MRYTVNVERTGCVDIEADSKEEAMKIALSMYNDGAMDNYEDELVSVEVEGENDE